MTTKEIAEVLEQVAVLLELKGENPFRVRAYQNAARLVAETNIPLEEFIAQAKEHKVKGLGEHLTEAITVLYETGNLPFLEELRGELPERIFELLSVPGLGAKKVKVLYQELHIASLKELEDACLKGKVAALPGFGAKTQENILSGIHRLAAYSGNFLVHQANDAAKNVIQYLQASEVVGRIEVAGSLRRHKETVKDIDILATSKKPEELMKLFVTCPFVQSVTAQGETKSSIVLQSGIAVDLRVVTDKEFASALMYFTGSKEHNTALRTIAKDHGLKLNEYGLFKGERALPLKSEEDIFNKLGLAYIEPELREDQGEIEFAELVLSGKRTFPELVTDKDIRGVIHVHTTYSDGKNSLEEMARAVKELGYEYLGISDHSQSAAYAGGLKPDVVKRQHEEIDALNEKLKPFVVFKGIESDILADGSLDYKDSVLERFDFVVASVHSRFNLSEKEMTARITNAVQNPFTTILGHPTGRLLLQRDGYPVDIFAVLEACKTHGVAVELNANPRRLDLDWRYHKQAHELGVPIPICPDAHAIEHLKYISVGVGVARKGWLTNGDILNSFSTRELRKYFDRKKGQV